MTISAVAARRKKQLAARRATKASIPTTGSDGDACRVEGRNEGDFMIQHQLDDLLNKNNNTLCEEHAYEALQLAQSCIRKHIQNGKYQDACDMAYHISFTILQKGYISIASQLLKLLADILYETNTIENEDWILRIVELHKLHQNVIIQQQATSNNDEMIRLQRLQINWLQSIIRWSSTFGIYRYGHNTLHELLANQCWNIAMEYNNKLNAAVSSSHDDNQNNGKNEVEMKDKELIFNLQWNAILHMTLGEKPKIIFEWLQLLPKPTDNEIQMGHECLASVRDMLFIQSILLFIVVENLRDANTLIHNYIKYIEERNIQDLIISYTNKEDGIAPSYSIFGCIILRICEKDVKSKPLYEWLLKTFQPNEINKFTHNNKYMSTIKNYCIKIGHIYFHIQPPPSMLQKIESMMWGGMSMMIGSSTTLGKRNYQSIS